MRGRLNAAGAAAAGALLAVVAGCADPPVSPLPTQAPVVVGAAPVAPPGVVPGPPSSAASGAVATPVTATAPGRAAPAPVDTRPPATAAPTTTPTPSPSTTPPTSVTPSLPPDCPDAGRYDVDAAAPEPPASSLCLHPGAVMRVSNVGPDEVTVEPADLVTRAYEDGGETVTFTGVGDVSVTVAWRSEPYLIAVQVLPSPSPSGAD